MPVEQHFLVQIILWQAFKSIYLNRLIV